MIGSGGEGLPRERSATDGGTDGGKGMLYEGTPGALSALIR